ncbi:putative sieve element occlusion [Medicago truncatula]|nr:protein SIEVE ELEMENT OCCLUSION B [Medicago truncatula]ADN32804.1 sieve element occlusion by forisomes 3 [Medicago truncatula]KEH40982.1 sieve element occlusion protein [Medicago truncatula]RHN78456.1 putative sieve element occlusion [Medicago truncatula]
MSSSMAPSSLVSNVSAYSQQARTSNPLAWSDDKILETVYLTHVHTGERYDVESLFNLTSNILKRSTAVADSVASKTGTPVGLVEDRLPLSGYEPPIRKLKHISAQMMSTLPGEHHAHMTTMSILDQLKSHTWDGKAIFALAAFSLEYGNFWHLVQTPSGDTLGRSLATMNRVQSVDKNRQAIADYNSLVKNLLFAVECITELEKLSTKGYEHKDVPALSEAMQEIPVAVYWAIITAIICANHLDLLFGDSDDRYELSSYDVKLASIVSKLKAHLTRSRKHIGELEDYWRRKRVLQTPTEIVEVLKVLVFHNEIQDPLVFDGLNRQMVSIEVFRKKHVLVFISGLDSIRDEIRLLQSIYVGLQEEPRELKGYRKEDFKILWIPIVDDWTLLHKAEFDNLKLEMPWYVVEYFYPLAGIRLIREDLSYKNKPILPVLNPLGRIVNHNAMHMIFVWGIDAFPFRPTDDESLTQKWNWFWAEMKKVYPRLQDLIKGDTFIFIYGGTDPKWTQDFALAIEKIKRHEITRKADAVIEHFHFGKEDKRIVPRFWIGIESLFANMIQKKHKDPTIDEIKSLLCLKQDQPGWVLLSKGPNVKLLGRGDQMYATAVDFEIWKEKVLEKAGFDVAFKEYYERKRREYPVACANMQLANYPSDILDPIYCPDSNCGRSMEIASVSYKCCHGHTHENAEVAPAESGGFVQIEKRS